MINHSAFRFFFTLLLGTLLAGVMPARGQSDYVTTVENTPNLLGYWRYTPSSQANSEVKGYTGTFGGNAALVAPGSGPFLASDRLTPRSRSTEQTTLSSTPASSGRSRPRAALSAGLTWPVCPPRPANFFTIAGESQVGNDFDLQIETDNKIKFYTDGGSATIESTAFTAADLNTWVFVAATFTSGTDRNIYINGALVASSTPAGHSAGNGTFAMGASDVFGGRFFNGGLDEIAVYNRDLTAAEVAAIYNSRAVPEPATWALVLGGFAALIGLRHHRSRRRAA